MNKKGILLLTLVVLAALTTMAQGRKNMRINEVMAEQADSTQQGGWLELYNSSYGSNAIEKMFLTTLKPEELFKNKSNGQKADIYLQGLAASNPEQVYEIPRGDEVHTLIAPRSHVVFYFAQGDSLCGTFHIPFVIRPGSYIALYDVNGDLVDEVTLPATLAKGQTYAVKDEGLIPTVIDPDDSDYEWEVRDGATKMASITPGNYNTRAQNENIEKFHKNDPHGFIIAIFAMGILFVTLSLLYVFFKLFGLVARDKKHDDQQAAAPTAAKGDTAEQGETTPDEETMAAICFALYQHLNAHDQESGVITLLPRNESAWGSKSLMMRQLPKK